MIRRFALVSGLILTGAVAFSPKAFAQSVDVNFEGNIGPECSFAAPTPGRLVYATQEQFAGTGTISSDAPGGVSGEVEVLCNTDANLEITDARLVSFTPTNPEFNEPNFIPDGGDLEVVLVTSLLICNFRHEN
ncbi:MAG: hypothetical protein F6K58_20510 [Symploca sp. SIO2E9]|nr:hypothetical protein [Symploca sp. SIO2E9]